MFDFAVIGLGYVGLPLAYAATHSGMTGVGIELSTEVVDSLSAGRSHIDDLDDAQISDMVGRGFLPTTDEALIGQARTIIICVPTPLGAEGGPDLSAVRHAAEMVGRHLSAGSLVVLESTTWPGTTEEFVRPLLQAGGLVAGVDFHLAYSPERIDPGNRDFGLHNTPKVVGGFTDACAVKAGEFYASFVGSVVRASGTREAEMSKLLENTYRQVNIALVNEMARFSQELDIDIWDVIRCAATKPFGYQPFYPGPGVGGHCIPIDPSYLSHRVKAELGYPFRFVELAQEINRSMPQYVVQRAQLMLNDRSLSVRGAKVLLLGVTYKANVRDMRESPSKPVGEILAGLGADVRFADPFVEEWPLADGVLQRVSDVEAALNDADLVVHLQAHDNYSQAIISRTSTPVLDTRGVLAGPHVTRL